MTDHQEEPRLIAIKGGPEPPARTLAKREAKTAAGDGVARTPTGDTAPDIVNAWAAFYQELLVGVPVPPRVQSRMRGEVKVLITAGYRTDEIKWGLLAWSVLQLENDFLSESRLERLVWKWARDHSAGSDEWRQQLMATATAAGGGTSVPTSGGSKAQGRREHTLEAMEAFRKGKS